MVGGAAFFYRLARRSESDFFLAGRGLPWWLPASSVFSTRLIADGASEAAVSALDAAVRKHGEFRTARFLRARLEALLRD